MQIQRRTCLLFRHFSTIMPRLSTNSAAVKLLNAKMSSGKAASDMIPSQVWKLSPTFQQHKLPAFSQCLYKLRKQIPKRQSTSKELNDGGDDVNRNCTGSRYIDHQSNGLIDDEAEVSDEENSEDCMETVCEELIINEHAFKPIYLLLEWQEHRSMTKGIPIAILLPSGVNIGDFYVRFLDRGEYLKCLVRWPGQMLDPELVHVMWIQSHNEKTLLEPYHPKIIGFQNALKKFRKFASDSVESHVRIPLPFAVQTHIENKDNLQFRRNSARIVYVDLKAAVEPYAVTQDKEEFTVL